MSGDFAFFLGAEEALRSVLRAYSIFHHLNHWSVASPSLAQAQCDCCRNELGPFPHVYWRMQFCSLNCMSAYQRRLFPESREMLEPFQTQVKECRSQAERATNKIDREFWLKMALRWETFLQQRKQDVATPKTARGFRNGRSRFVRRRAA
jgi:hypothetical protein